jgi:hypothetical protein
MKEFRRVRCGRRPGMTPLNPFAYAGGLCGKGTSFA